MCVDWWAATLAGERALMLALRRSDVDDLNARARHHYRGAGLLSGPILTIDDRPYQAGDRIMTLRNNRRLGTRNGVCATIDYVDPTRRSLRVRTDTGSVLDLPAAYLDAGYVRHGYATTVHKAQGQTVDRAFVLGSDQLYREAGYVALSRGRHQNHLYLIDRTPRPEAHASELMPPDPIDALTRSLAVSQAQHLAVDTGVDRDQIGHTLDTLIHERDRLQQLQRACPPSHAYEINTLTTRRDDIAEQLAYSCRNLETIETQRGWRHRKDRNAASHHPHQPNR